MMLRLAKYLFKVSAFVKKALRIFGEMRPNKGLVEGIAIGDLGFLIGSELRLF